MHNYYLTKHERQYMRALQCFNIILKSGNKQIYASGYALRRDAILLKSMVIMKKRMESSPPGSDAEESFAVKFSELISGRLLGYRNEDRRRLRKSTFDKKRSSNSD